MRTASDSTELIDERTRWWDWPAALLFLAAILTATSRLTSTRWTEDLGLVSGVAFLGVLAGLALGQSRFSPGLARLFALVYGLFVVPWRIGLTLGQGVAWHERLVSMLNRLLVTADQIVRQQPVNDNLFFLFLMATLFWALAVYGGFSLTRYAHAWRAILPTGLALVVIHSYDSFFTVRGWYLAAFVFFSLLLVARVHYLEQFKRWRQNRSYLPPYLGLDFVRTALIVAGVLVLLAWTAPALASTLQPAEAAWQNVSAPWHKLRDRIGTAFSSLQASVGFVTDFYGETLSLGRGNPLTDSVVMTVQAPSQLEAGERFYWRTRVYDYYNGQWSSTLSATREFTPKNFELTIPEYQGRVVSNFTFKTFYNIQDMFTPALPLWVSRPVNVEMAVSSDNTMDVGMVEATPYLRAGDTYEVRASLSAASKKQLRSAGTEYPSWITARYLELPKTVTSRTEALAKEITAGYDNPYDKVEAVTDWLRNNIAYQETIPLPPASKEPIDWFLFDYKKGFCNYYATSEVVMLRSLGIPARLAVGYAQGERTSLEDQQPFPTYNPYGPNRPQEIASPGDLYTVRHRDAHAWPEVFFPGYGWVEFEPTASQLPILRPEDENFITGSNQPDPAQGDTPDFNKDNQRPEDRIPSAGDPESSGLRGTIRRLPAVFWVLLVGVIIGLSTLSIDRVRRQRGAPPLVIQLEKGFRRIGFEPPTILRRLAYHASLTPLVRAYAELNRALARLGARPKPTDTPAERADHLTTLLPVLSSPVKVLVGEYQTATYSPEPGNAFSAQTAGMEIRKRSFIEVFKRFFARFQEPIRNRRTSF